MDSLALLLSLTHPQLSQITVQNIRQKFSLIAALGLCGAGA